MTTQEFEAAVQSHFDNKTPAFLERIRDALPTAIARFCQQWQWEFLDKYTTFATETSTKDASGKTIFTLPSDFYKIIVLWTDSYRLKYLTRTEWAELQMSGGVTTEFTYTVIGKELVLSGTISDTVYGIYTRTSQSFDLDDIPAQFHYAIQMAVEELLAPAYVTVDGKTYPNPDVNRARRAFREATVDARILELRSKGRGKRIKPAEHIRRINDYR